MADIVYIDPPPRPRNGWGVLGFVLSLVSFATCFVASPIALLVSLLALFKRPRGLATAGVVLSGLGTAVLVSGALMVQQANVELQTEFARANTQSTLQQARELIEKRRWNDAEGRLPDGIEGNKWILQHEESFLDGWSSPVRYEQADGSYVIRSAGADGKFDTFDDLTIDEDAPRDRTVDVDVVPEPIEFQIDPT